MFAPVDVATRETLDFVTQYTSPGGSLLEIGCGEGHLAAELARLGYGVIGLESNRERAVLTSLHQVSTVLAEWPRFESVPFDAIAFTRSLHHIDPLRASVAQARALLKPGGTLLLEDFAVDAISDTDLDWFCEVIRSDTARSLLLDEPDELVCQLRDGGDPMALWTQRHDHVHPWPAIEEAIRQEFAVEGVTIVPYFYRYFVYGLPPTTAAAEFLETVLEEESSLVSAGEIVGLGRRIVGSSLPHRGCP